MVRAFFLLAVAACSAAPADGDITGPYTGPRHRFVVDGIRFPQNNNEARTLGDDLDGDRTADNQIGMVMGTLAGQGNANTHAADMIASGVIASTVEMQADDLLDDDRVGVWYYGADGTPVTPVGGRMIDGFFVSNTTRDTDAAGAAMFHLPVFADADPSMIELVAMQLDLKSDGRGGFDGIVRGAFRGDDVNAATHPGIVQMLDADPGSHRSFWKFVDGNRDGTVTRTEIEQSSLLQSLLYRDVTLDVDGGPLDVLSAGFAIHLAPCESGSCGIGAIESCFDRVLGGDESAVDCGGSCQTCPGGATCGAGADCQTGSCDGGICRAPTCSDGIRSGFESDVDCGGPCPGCAAGQTCGFDGEVDFDCASGSCNANRTCA